jgi:hypothetical protein
MTDLGRMGVGELVGKVLADEHADVLRQAEVWLAQELMEAEVSELVVTPTCTTRPAHLDRATGQPVRRYEHPHPGDLVHLDSKKPGNIPAGGGHRFLG